MLNNKTIKFLTIFISLLFFTVTLNFAGNQDSITKKAFQLFEEAKYKEASPLFKQLLATKPNLALLNYYYGVCETENRHFSRTILNHLLKANNEESPEIIDYYLGIQYQANNNWEKALKHYNKFKLSKTYNIDSLEISERIQQCFQKENPYLSEYIFEEDEIIVNNPFDSSMTVNEIPVITDSAFLNVTADTFETDLTDNLDAYDIEEEKVKVEPEMEVEKENDIINHSEESSPIDMVINSKITYHSIDEFKTNEGKELFEEADSTQKKLDELLLNIDNLRQQYLNTEDNSKQQLLGEEILTLENETFSIKDQVNKLLFESAKYENEYWQAKTDDEIEDFIKQQKAELEITAPVVNDNKIKADTTGNLILPDFLIGQNENKAELEERVENDELVYKIQIGAYSRGLPRYIERLYKKLSYIRKIENYTDDKGVVVYTTGNLSKFEDAVKMKDQVRQEGVEDAFVVPYFNGKRITLEKAKNIEAGL